MRKFTANIVLLAASFFLISCSATNARFPTKSFGQPYDKPTTIKGILSKPEGEGPFPAVVLLHTCGGLKSHVTQDWPNFLTDLGYVVLTVDSFGPRWLNSCGQLIGWKILQAEDAFGALEYLATLPAVNPDRIGVMGFSAGAIAINSVLANQMKTDSDKNSFRAAIAMYGHCRELFNYYENSVPLLEIMGEYDTQNTPSCIDAGKNFPGLKVEVLPGAHHAFDNFGASGTTGRGGSCMQYSESATQRARKLTKEFFSKYLGR
jgi:dienelactone hydrolase